MSDLLLRAKQLLLFTHKDIELSLSHTSFSTTAENRRNRESFPVLTSCLFKVPDKDSH